MGEPDREEITLRTLRQDLHEGFADVKGEASAT